MDDALYFMLKGCDLAKRLEHHLQSLQKPQPSNDLCNSCQGIISAFTKALDCLNGCDIIQMAGFDDRSLAGNTLKEQRLAGDVAVAFPNELDDGSMEKVMNIQNFDPLLHLMGSPGSSGRDGRIRRKESKKRKGFSAKNTIRVLAPLIGSVETMPDDGFTWRKYGQKKILGTRYPRNYFRCIHKTFYGCDAKKQVQRMDDDPYMYEIIYCGSHTCQFPGPALVNPVDILEPDLHEPSPGLPFGSANQQTVEDAGEHPIWSMEDIMFEFGDIVFKSGSSSSNSMDSIFTDSIKGNGRWEGGQFDEFVSSFF